MKIKERIQITKAKILTLSVFLGLGFGFVVLGADDYRKQPEIKYNADFAAIINENDETYDVGTLFHAPNGIMENRGIYATVWIQVQEHNNNTESEVSFPNARLRDTINIEEPKVDRIASLHFKENRIGGNVYESKPLLIYNNAGSYGMILKITNENYTITKEYSDVLQVGSWDDYKSEKRENESKGLALMIIGITLISTATIFTTVVDLFGEYSILKKNKMYEK